MSPGVASVLNSRIALNSWLWLTVNLTKFASGGRPAIVGNRCQIEPALGDAHGSARRRLFAHFSKLPPVANPFETLGVPVKFDLDMAELHKRFLSASSANHPDRFTDPVQQAEAAERSAVVNEAYRTLKAPESRANALLAVLGGAAKEDDKALPPDLLAEMLDVREQQEEAEAAHDTAKLRDLAAWAGERRRERLTNLADIFSQAMTRPAGARHFLLKNARLELNALRYIQRMIEQLPN